MIIKHRQWWSLVILALLGAGGWGAYRGWWSRPSPDAVEVAPLRASGVIHAQRVTVASELGGVVAAIPVREGQVVAAGELVAQLDRALIEGEIAAAAAGVAVAEAGLRQAEAGARPGQIVVAEAQLAQARAGQVAASRVVSATQALVDTPQQLELEIAVAQGHLAAARAAHGRATAVKDATEVIKAMVEGAWNAFDGGGRQRFPVRSGPIPDLLGEHLPPELVDLLPDDIGAELGDRTIIHGDYELILRGGHYDFYVWRNIDFPLNAHLVPNQWWQAWVGVNAAAAEVAGWEAQLGQLYAQRAAPQALEAQAGEARALEAEAVQQVAQAQAQVDGLRAGLTPEELALIEAQVGQARAALDALLRKAEMLSLTAPITATVVEMLVQEAEVVAQGAPLLTLADLGELTLTVYIPEARLSDVWLDQRVEIRVNSFPDQVFRGQVMHIADQAEFTPRNVSTEEKRASLVFAVDIQIDNAEGVLKPGMPADVQFQMGAGAE